MKIRDRMQTDVISLQADEPLINAVEATASARIRHIPILDGERLVGILSENDIKHATPSALIQGNEALYRRILTETPVSRVMRRAPITIGPDATMGRLVRLMLENKIGAVPVVEGDKLVGIISELDVLRSYLELLQLVE